MNSYNLQVLPPVDFFIKPTQVKFLNEWPWERLVRAQNQETLLGEWTWERVGKERYQEDILNLNILGFESIYANEPVYKQNHLALASIISTTELFNRIPKPKSDDILTCFHGDLEKGVDIQYYFQYFDGRWIPSSLANFTKFYHVTRKIASGFFCVKN